MDLWKAGSLCSGTQAGWALQIGGSSHKHCGPFVHDCGLIEAFEHQLWIAPLTPQDAHRIPTPV